MQLPSSKRPWGALTILLFGVISLSSLTFGAFLGGKLANLLNGAALSRVLGTGLGAAAGFALGSAILARLASRSWPEDEH